MPATPPPTGQQALTAEQASRVPEAAAADRLAALFTSALMLGLPPGELLGLSWAEWYWWAVEDSNL
jgi:integrase